MKLSSTFIIAALLGATYVDQTQAVKIATQFTDDLVKSLAEDMQRDVDGSTE